MDSLVGEVYDSRCKCLIIRESGEVTRCSAMVNNPRTHRYCHFHTKVMDGLCGSAPQDQPGTDVDSDGILMYTDIDTLLSVPNR